MEEGEDDQCPGKYTRSDWHISKKWQEGVGRHGGI